MIKYLIKIIWGSNCNHDWIIIKKNETEFSTKMLFCCKKCGDFKTKTL